MNQNNNFSIPLTSKGFTLIELMIVIAIIGILAAIAIPNYLKSRQKAKTISLVADLKNFEKGFFVSAATTGKFPDDSHIVLPPGGIENYLSTDQWNTVPYVGGSFNWEGPDSYPYAGIALFEPTAPQSEFELIDEYIDNGNLNTGKLRITANSRYTYIISE